MVLSCPKSRLRPTALIYGRKRSAAVPIRSSGSARKVLVLLFYLMIPQVFPFLDGQAASCGFVVGPTPLRVLGGLLGAPSSAIDRSNPAMAPVAALDQ